MAWVLAEPGDLAALRAQDPTLTSLGPIAAQHAGLTLIATRDPSTYSASPAAPHRTCGS